MKTSITEEEAKSAYQGKEQQAEELLKDREKTQKKLKQANILLNKIKKVPVIGKIADDIATAIELVKDYINGSYKNVPTWIIVSTMGGLLYILSPIDLIPDFLPLVGWIDDAAVFSAILASGLSVELGKYRRWKKTSESDPTYQPIWSKPD